jgi:ferric-dicitrate binding protein FerR (iron transport regulator)
VHADGAVARDIGTRFDVRRYPEDRTVRVVVIEGMVAVVAGGASRDRPLRAGDLAVVADTAVAVTHDADVAALTGWSRGELTFRNRPLGEVVVDLSRWFGVEVQLADPGLARRLVTATVTDEPVATAMDVLAPAFGTSYERHGTAIVLRTLSR